MPALEATVNTRDVLIDDRYAVGPTVPTIAAFSGGPVTDPSLH